MSPVRGERRDEPRGEGRRSDSRALVVSRFRDDLEPRRRFLGRFVEEARRVPLSRPGAWSAAPPPPRHSSSAPARASGLRVRCASASARTRPSRTRSVSSRRSRAPPRASSARPSSSPSAVAGDTPGSAASRPRASLPPGDTAARLRPDTVPAPRRAPTRDRDASPRASFAPPLALAAPFGATR